jgi:integrase
MSRSRPSNLTRWVETVKTIGVPGLHFHDLRHTGNHLAARTGATTKDLMARMGHDDMRAALIYQHATAEADREIADRLSDLVEGHTGSRPDDDGGPAGALVPVG